jgi:SAM-dependent methyltransferase
MPLLPHDWHQRFLIQSEWTRETRQYLYHRTGMVNAQRILDVGCGTGVLIQELHQALEVPIIGLDINIDFIAVARKNSPSAKFVLGDGQAMPLEANTFDCCFCHFLLLWVEDPLGIIREMKRVTQPGGSILAIAEPDYGGRIDHPSMFSILGEWQTSALRHQGADPNMGRKLSGIFHQAGLGEIEVGVIGAQWVGQPSKQDLSSEWEIIRSDLESLNISSEVMHTSEELREHELIALESGDRILYVPTFYACGRVLD